MIENGYRYGSNWYSAFSYKSPIPSLIASFFFYTPFLLHLHPPRTDQRVSCRTFNAMIAVFSLDILGLSSVLCFFNAYPCQQNFLEYPPRWQITFTDLDFGEPRRYSSSAQTLGPLWSKLTFFSTNTDFSDHVYSSLDNVTS